MTINWSPGLAGLHRFLVCPDTLSLAQIVPPTVTIVMQGYSTLTRKSLLSPTHHTFGPFHVDRFVTIWLPSWKVTAPRWGAVSF